MTAPNGWEGVTLDDLRLPWQYWVVLGICAAVVIYAPWQGG